MKKCTNCNEELPNTVKKCSNCQEPQGWYQKVNVIAHTLSLVLAFLSILSLTLPHAIDALDPNEPDIMSTVVGDVEIYKRNVEKQWVMKVSFASHNSGEVAAVFRTANAELEINGVLTKLTGNHRTAQESDILTPENHTIIKDVHLVFDEPTQKVLETTLGEAEYQNFKLPETKLNLYFNGLDGKLYTSKSILESRRVFLINE